MPETPHQPMNVPLPDGAIGLPECRSVDSQEDDALLKQELARLTPTNEKLLALADKSPPPPAWIDEDEEIPF